MILIKPLMNIVLNKFCLNSFLKRLRIRCYFQLDVEVAPAADVPFPPPLDEGVTEEIYTRYIATPEPEPTPEVSQRFIRELLQGYPDWWYLKTSAQF